MMIPNGNGINYLAVKKLSALLRGITSKYHGNFCCKDYHYSFAIKNKLKSYECLYENKDFCNISMPSEDTKILELNEHQTSDTALFVIYADLD